MGEEHAVDAHVFNQASETLRSSSIGRKDISHFVLTVLLKALERPLKGLYIKGFQNAFRRPSTGFERPLQGFLKAFQRPCQGL